MSVKPRPIEPKETLTPYEKESKVLDEKLKFWVEYWHEDGVKARRELQRLEEQRERETVFAKFKPVRPLEPLDARKYPHPVEGRL